MEADANARGAVPGKRPRRPGDLTRGRPGTRTRRLRPRPSSAERHDPVQAHRRWCILLILGAIVFWMFVPEKPVDYTDIHDHFKYGSIGSEAGKGMPYRIWKVLPEMFPQYLPDGDSPGDMPRSVSSTRPTRRPADSETRPIGFSMRRMQGIDFVGLNCSVCHTGTYRGSPSETPEQATIELGMPAHQLDLLAYFKFLFDCTHRRPVHGRQRDGGDGRTTEARPDRPADLHDRDPRVRQETLRLKALAQFMIDHPSGRGRIDTFTPYKTMNFGYRDTSDFSVGNADFPSIWNQRIREGMPLHWDGNNPSLFERNISAAMGTGATPVSLDVPRMNRVADWLLDLKPPRLPVELEARCGRGPSRRGPVPPALCRLPRAEGGAIQGAAGRCVAADRADQDRPRAARLVHASISRTTSTPWVPAGPGGSTTSARPTATPTSRSTGSGPARPTCTTARCRRSATCSIRHARPESSSKSATRPGRRAGRS